MRFFALFLVLFICFSCSDDGPIGEAPSIENLSVDPLTFTHGTQVQLQGTFDFEDPDGDIATASFELRPEGSPSHRLGDVEVTGADGITDGQVPFLLVVQAPSPGSIELGVTLTDEEGNESNELTETLLAE